MTIQKEIGDAEALRWLSGIFARELTPEMIEAYRAGDAEPYLAVIEGCCDLGDRTDNFRSAIDAWPSSDEAHRNLALQFAELFLLPGPNSAPPYASAYDPESDRSFGATHERLSELLKSAKLQIDWNANEPADHLSVILELAAVLSAENSQTASENLLVKELSPWLDKFRSKIRKSQHRNSFYGAAVELLSAYISSLSTDGS